MNDKLYILICEALEREAAAVIRAAGWEDVKLATFPECPDHPYPDWQSLTGAAQGYESDCLNTILIGGCCAVGPVESPEKMEYLRHHKADHCFELFINKTLVDAYITEGVHLMLPGLLSHWQQYMERGKFDRETAREFFNESTSKLVLLDTGVDPHSSKHMQEFADFTARPFDILPVGLDHFRELLSNYVLEWRLEKRQDTTDDVMGQSEKQVADYAMMLDLMGRLNELMPEEQAIDSILEMFSCLCAPDSLVFASMQDGEFKGIWPKDISNKQRVLALDQFASFQGDYAWTGSGKGFLLRMAHHGSTMGVLKIDGISFPEYKEHYLNLALSIAGVCGMAIANVRIFEQLQASMAERERIDKALQKAHDNLENKVEERTVQLQQHMQEAEEARQAMLYMLEDINQSTSEVEEGKKEWEQTFDAVTDPIFLHDREFRIKRVNKAYAEQVGMTYSDIIGRPYWEIFPKGDGPLLSCQKALKKAAAEEEINSEDGRTYLSHSYAVKAKEDIHNCSIHFMQDITERKQAEDQLSDAKSKLELNMNLLRSVIEEVPIRIFWKDRDSRYLGCNSLFARDAGLSSPEEVIGKTDFEMGWKDQAEFYREDDKVVMETGAPKLGYEEPQSTPKGETIWLRTSKVPLCNEAQEVTGILGVYEDITERKQAERALLQSEESLRNLVEADINALVVHRDFRLIYINPAARKLFEAPEGVAVPDVSVLDYVHPDYKNFARLSTRRILRTNKSLAVASIRMVRPSGQLDVEIASTPITFKHQQAVLSIIRDVTERKQNQEALKKSFERLQQSLEGTIQAIASAVEARDPYTAGHQRRVAGLSVVIAHTMGLDGNKVEGIHWGALIHDIGKINLPAEILSKPSRLTDIEYSLVQGHPQVGYDILKDIEFPWPVADIAHQHHERIDGSGYPQGLKGEGICMEARIVAVADVVEAMASHRPYRPGLGIDAALGEIKRGRGKQYDADVADACFKLFREDKFSFEE